MKYNITNLMMNFNHEVTADKITFYRTDNMDRTLLGQLEDSINKSIENNSE